MGSAGRWRKWLRGEEERCKRPDSSATENSAYTPVRIVGASFGTEGRSGSNLRRVKAGRFSLDHDDYETGARPLRIQERYPRRISMSSETSEQVMALLKELAMLKELDKAYEANPTEGEHEAYRLRRQRHEEITTEIKALASERDGAK